MINPMSPIGQLEQKGCKQLKKLVVQGSSDLTLKTYPLV